MAHLEEKAVTQYTIRLSDEYEQRAAYLLACKYKKSRTFSSEKLAYDLKMLIEGMAARLREEPAPRESERFRIGADGHLRGDARIIE